MFFNKKNDSIKKSLNEIPKEVLLILISYLDSRSVVDLMLVNKYFLSISIIGFFKSSIEEKVFIPNSTLHFFLNNITYEFDEISLYSDNFMLDDKFLKYLSIFIRKMKGFNSLHLNLRNVDFGKFQNNFKGVCGNLRKLSLNNFCCEKKNLFSFLSKCTILKKLKLEKCDLKPQKMINFNYEKLQKLTSFHFKKTTNFIEDFVKLVVPEKIVRINIEKSNVFVLDFQSFQKFTNLNTLLIETEKLFVHNWNKIEKLQFKKLREIKIIVFNHLFNYDHSNIFDEKYTLISELDNLIDFVNVKLKDFIVCGKVFKNISQFDLSTVERLSFLKFYWELESFLGKVFLTNLKVFNIKGGDFSFVTIISLLLHANNLREIKIHSIKFYPYTPIDKMMPLFEKKKSEKRLENIIFQKVDDIDPSNMYNLISIYQKTLRKLIFLNCKFCPLNFIENINEIELESLDKLYELNFNESKKFNVMLTKINEKVKYFPSLSRFSVSSTIIKDKKDIRAVEEILSKSEDIEVFDSEGVPISSLEIHSKMLRELVISGANIKEEKLVEFLSYNRNLMKFKQTYPPIFTKKENVIKCISGKRFLLNLSINLQKVDKINLNGILKELLQYTPDIQQLIISGRNCTCSGKVLTKFLLKQERLTLFVMDTCCLKNNTTAIEQIKREIRKAGRSAPRIILPIGVDFSKAGKSYTKKYDKFISHGYNKKSGCILQ